MDKIEKNFGKGSIMKLGDENVQQVEVIPDRFHRLERCTFGVGGYPKGRIIEIYGPESSGKTTLAIHAIAEAQKREESLLLLMRNMHSIVSMLPNWEWM